MGETLDTLHLIDAKQLHPRYYAGSLIQQAISCHLLSDIDVSKIQSVFVFLLSQYPNDDFLDRESEQLLFQALSKRKQCLSSEEKQQVEQALGAIQKEDFD